MIRALFLLSLVAVTLTATVPKQGLTRFHTMRHGLPPLVAGKNTRATEENWMTQKLDHFDILDNRTWQQRYITSSDSYVPGGPVFLLLGGEGEINSLFITGSFIGDLAEQNNGYMIVLEHRYYGESHPTENITTANLKWLNADQALEDAAVFTSYMMETMDLTGPWFVSGFSYSANLAAWARARYPHLYYAAHASSAPVLAQLDYVGYFEVVSEALKSTSAECPIIVKSAIDELTALVEQGDADQITELFNLCTTIDLANPDDVWNLYSVVVNPLAGEVQFAHGGNLDVLCNTFDAGQATPLATIAEYIRGLYGDYCILAINQEVLDYYRDSVLYSPDIFRAWSYQTCMEIGLYTTLSSPDLPFGQLLPVEYNLLWCPNVYGPEFTREVNEAGIARTNLVNGGLTPDVTRVLYTHGSLDPWSKAGILQDLNEETPVVMIEGVSHCRDMLSEADSDPQELKDARVRIAQIISDWVADALAKNKH